MTRKQIEAQVWTIDNNHPVVAVNKLLKEVREYEAAKETVEIYNGVRNLTVEQLRRFCDARSILKYA